MATHTKTVSLTDLQQTILSNDLYNDTDNAGIDDWVQAAVTGKINNCKTRMANTATATLKADDSVSSMPATDDGLIDALLARDDYKNRQQRDDANGI